MVQLSASAGEPPARPAVILILDDSAADREVLRRFLTADPLRTYTIHERTDIDDALSACTELQPDCILLDYSLGDGTGLDFLDELAEAGGTRRFPVVMLTGSGSEEVAAEAFRAGAQDYLVKDTLAADALQRAIRGAIYKAKAERLLDEQRAELQRLYAAAQTANARKDEFLATLSHELRTPLTPILSAVSSINPAEMSKPELEEVFATIRRNVELEARLIDDLLDLTRIVSGKLRLDFASVDAHEALRHALDTCRDDLAAKRLKLTRNLAATSHRVQADPARLQQVFWNLVKNAVKFTPAGGEICVESRNTPDGALEVQVTDNGCGIHPAALPKIFDAFEQGGAQTTQRFGGLGLGLAIAKALIAAHGGTIEASNSGQPQGARFTIRIPLDEAAPQQSAAPISQAHRYSSPEPVDSTPPLILLVEDHADSSRLLAGIMRRHGYRVVTAASVAEAVSVFEREAVRFVVSDIGLPDGDGVGLMEQLRARRPVDGIAVSGYGMEHDHARSRAAGFREHLTKPVNWSHLHAALTRLCAGAA